MAAAPIEARAAALLELRRKGLDSIAPEDMTDDELIACARRIALELPEDDPERIAVLDVIDSDAQRAEGHSPALSDEPCGGIA